jgi:hypothetical protein
MGIRLVFPSMEKLGVVGKRFSLILPKKTRPERVLETLCRCS